MKGLLYYTNNRCQERIALACRHQIERCRKAVGEYTSLVSVSQYPINFGHNIVLPLRSSILSMFKQNLAGLEAITTDIVFFVEHDVLYHPSHFEFTPPRDDMYYFNTNVWALDDDTGQALYYDGMKMVSGLVAYRDILIEHFRKKIEWVEREGRFSHNRMGFEPGRKPSKGRTDDYDWDVFRSERPNVDIKGSHNITRKRFRLKDYRSRRHIEASWTLADEIPYWGKTKGRFDEFLRDVYENIVPNDTPGRLPTRPDIDWLEAEIRNRSCGLPKERQDVCNVQKAV